MGIVGPCRGERFQCHRQLAEVDVDPRHIVIQQLAVLHFSRGLSFPAHGSSDGSFNIVSGNSVNRSDTIRLPLYEWQRDVVPVPHPLLAGVAGTHPVATIIEDSPDQCGFGLSAGANVIVLLFNEPGLNRVKKITIENRGLVAR